MKTVDVIRNVFQTKVFRMWIHFEPKTIFRVCRIFFTNFFSGFEIYVPVFRLMRRGICGDLTPPHGGQIPSPFYFSKYIQNIPCQRRSAISQTSKRCPASPLSSFCLWNPLRAHSHLFQWFSPQSFPHKWFKLGFIKDLECAYRIKQYNCMKSRWNCLKTHPKITANKKTSKKYKQIFLKYFWACFFIPVFKRNFLKSVSKC